MDTVALEVFFILILLVVAAKLILDLIGEEL